MLGTSMKHHIDMFVLEFAWRQQFSRNIKGIIFRSRGVENSDFALCQCLGSTQVCHVYANTIQMDDVDSPKLLLLHCLVSKICLT